MREVPTSLPLLQPQSRCGAWKEADAGPSQREQLTWLWTRSNAIAEEF